MKAAGRFVVFGAGQIGSLIAKKLAHEGAEVTVVSRHARQWDEPAVRHVARDVMTEPLDDLCSGVDAVFVALNVAYDHTLWARTLPLLNQRVADAARGTRLVVLENLYLYGATQAHLRLREDLPLAPSSKKGMVRADIARDLFSPARVQSQLVTSLRPPDFWGPGLTSALLDDKALVGIGRGKKPLAVGDVDALHARAFIDDVAAAMIALARAGEDVYGRPWHAPSIHVSTRALVGAIARAAGVADPGVRAMPGWALAALSPVVPILGELHEMLYLWERPHLVDDGAFRARFHVEPMCLEDGARACAEVVRPSAARRAQLFA